MAHCQSGGGSSAGKKLWFSGRYVRHHFPDAPSDQSGAGKDIRTEVLQYLAARGASAKNQVKAPADYYINNQGEYVVHLQLLQKGASVIDLSLAAPSLTAAKAMCKQWPKKYEEIYAKIMERLL